MSESVHQDALNSKNITEALSLAPEGKDRTYTKDVNGSQSEVAGNNSISDDSLKKDSDSADIDIEPDDFQEILRLEPEEVEIFEAVDSGNIDLANELIQKMSSNTLQQLSIKHNDERDSLFHIAVRRQDEAMLELLFFRVPNVENLVYDILLLAVSISNVNLVQIILHEIDSNAKTRVERGCLSKLPRWPNSQFHSHKTPMMLSGIIGNYELITIFGSRGEEIQAKFDPIKTDYKASRRKRRPCCGECCYCCIADPHETGFDQLATDYLQIHKFQAKCSPEMLCYFANTTKHFDPILKALEYINELSIIKGVEIEFLSEYNAIISKLKDFAVQMVSRCENPLELDLLFSRREGYHGAYCTYPRIDMAIEMGFKEFVAHPHVQGALYMQWAGNDWVQWRLLSAREKFLQFLYRILFLPLYLLFLCGEQGNHYGRLLATPQSRMIYYCISQVIFIVLSMTQQKLELDQPRLRKPRNIYLEVVLVLFVLGQIHALVKKFFMAPKTFFTHSWNWFDTVTYTVYCSCFACWGMLHIRDAKEKSIYFERYQPAERLNWDYLDLFMVADCFLALGTVMAWARLLRYVKLHPTIGPVQIALGKMIRNIALFIPLFSIVFFSFALAITAVYAPYVRVAQEDQPKHALGAHMNILYKLYWGLYGMTDTSTADIGTWLIRNGTSPDSYHYITAELAGTLLFGGGSMMVAYMVNTFGAIIEENDINWKFSRAELWNNFSKASVMPPPLNLIPTVWDVVQFFRTLKEVRKHPGRYFFTCKCPAYLHSEILYSEREVEHQEEVYHDFIKALTRRFFRHQLHFEDNVVATAEESTTLRDEIEELQSLIGDVLLRDTTNKNRRHGRDDPGSARSNKGSTKTGLNTSNIVLESLNNGEPNYRHPRKNSTSTAPDSAPAQDTAPSGNPTEGENYGVSSSFTQLLTLSKEESSSPKEVSVSEGRPSTSAVQSAVLKYTPRLSAEQSPTQASLNDISLIRKISGLIKAPSPISELEKIFPSPPYLLSTDPPNKTDSDSQNRSKKENPLGTPTLSSTSSSPDHGNQVPSVETSQKYTYKALQASHSSLHIAVQQKSHSSDRSRIKINEETIGGSGISKFLCRSSHKIAREK